MGTTGRNPEKLSAETAEERARLLADFFRTHRERSHISLEQVATALALGGVETIQGYEDGSIPIPLEDVFSLTNLLNIAPEDVLALFVGLATDGEPG